MPKNKDLKRLTRSRMQKTGESYTTARSKLVQKTGRVSTPELAALAGMSDDTVRAKTDRTWPEWVRILDAKGATSMPHRDIAVYVHEAHGVSRWWAQTVTVGYERIRGLREKGQRRSGTFEGTVKLTLREQAGAVGMTSPFESCRPRYCVPSEECATSKLSVMTRLQQVSSDAEEVLDKFMNGQESLGLTRRFEPSHLPFTLPRRLVRDLGSIVLVLVGAVDDGWHDLAVSGAVASQLVGDEPPGWPALPLQQLTKEAFRGSPIASRLDEDIDDVAILVHRTPEILPLTLDGYKHLVQVPRIAEATLPSLQPASVFWTELDAPKSDRFIRDGDPPLGKEVLYIFRGRDRPYGRPPAQIPASAANALGSYLRS